MAKDVLRVTDGHAAYAAVAREAGISHQAVTLRAGPRIRAAVHMQKVPAYRSRLRPCWSAFHGVATLPAEPPGLALDTRRQAHPLAQVITGSYAG